MRSISGGGTTVTCSGNLASGVLLSNGGGPYSVLNINNLTTNIAPASGVTGVEFTSNGAAEVNLHPGPFAIITTDAVGIFAASNNSTVTINSTADISTSGGSATGILASGQNALVSITSSGNIATSGNNAFGIAAGAVHGPVTVISSGDIATSGTFSAGINVGHDRPIRHQRRRILRGPFRSWADYLAGGTRLPGGVRSIEARACKPMVLERQAEVGRADGFQGRRQRRARFGSPGWP